MSPGGFAIESGTIATPHRLIHNGLIIVKGKNIVFVGKTGVRIIPRNYERIDAKGRLVLPGFIDLHVHGGGGCESLDATPEAVDTICSIHAEHGTTGLLLTVMSASENRIKGALRCIAAKMENGIHGSRILGVHLEGPFLASGKQGIHSINDLRPISFLKFKSFMAASGNAIKVVTVSPELQGADEFTRRVCSTGVRVSLGHTKASFKRANEILDCGATHATHMFNGMSAIESREPGAAGALLVSDEVCAEIIADGVHVHPAMVRLLIEIKGQKKVVLITDACRAAGTCMKSFSVTGHFVTVSHGAPRTEDGDLAGSLLTMETAAFNVARWTGLPLVEVVNMASITPAIELGIEKHKGSLEAGKDADIVIADDNMKVTGVFVEGQKMY